jgi:DNA polymerase-3 subunit alpha (Gram-positive type)
VAVPEIFSRTKIPKELESILKNQEISKIIVNTKKQSILLEIISNVLIDVNELENFKIQVKNEYSLKEFNIKIKYLECLLNKEYLSNVLKIILLRLPIIKPFISGAILDIDGNTVKLKNLCGPIYFLEKYNVKNIIQEIIAEEMNINVQVIFECKKYVNEEYHIRKQTTEEEINLNNETKEKIKNLKLGEEIKNSSLPFKVKEISNYNKKKLENKTPIIQITSESGKVNVQGKIFCVETRDFKDEKTLIVFYIFDNTYSIVCKIISKRDSNYKEKIKKDAHVKVRGEAVYDKYSREVCINVKAIEFLDSPPQRMDNFTGTKRVELHAHTKMSAMDGMVDVKELIECASRWNHKAIAITDHGCAQAFPDAYNAGKKFGIKIIYGMEGYFVNDESITKENEINLNETYVVFDIETTGLNNRNDAITEIGAVKIFGSEFLDAFSALINPGKPVPPKITELTGITDYMLKDKPIISEILPKFLNFCKGSTLVAHNANFDAGFIRENANKLNLPFDFKIIDTLAMSRAMLKNLNKHKLDVVAKHLGIALDNHHRAVDDATCTAKIFLKLLEIKEKKDDLIQKHDKIVDKSIIKQMSYHIIILVKNKIGLKNLYKLISLSNLEYFYKKPKIPKSVLNLYREGLILGSACESGELYRAILENRSEIEIERIASFYDYLEIQPLGNNNFLIKNGNVTNEEELKDINKKIVQLGKKFKKRVVATCDSHFLNPEDEVYRRVLFGGQGYKDADDQAPLYIKTTEEMLEEFSYLGEEAHECVITNTVDICDDIEEIKPIPDGLYPPKIENSEKELMEICKKKVHEIYGEKLPEIVEDRFNRELGCILKYEFAVMYIIAQKLVKKSNDEGYLVGSRGSVGSSFIAFLAGITEINALSPHYVCPICKKSEFIKDNKYKSGIDLPNKVCECGIEFKKDGFDIPFETFLGFNGDKIPDIDLNFSGEYQAKAHKYVETLFGEGYVFRAGTIGTIADKTAQMFAKKYYEKKGENPPSNAEIKRVSIGSIGVKRTTGQHPGGIIVCPKNMEIYDFCPVQRPADDTGSDVITTHFDFHSIHDNLLKLDILGHDDPTTIKMLENLTKVDSKTIPLDDKGTMSLFSSNEILNLDVESEDFEDDVGTTGIPEFGTKFVMQILAKTLPTTFSELILISGMSHGENVWTNNAQDLIKERTASLAEVICVRDDIMLYLMRKGLESNISFEITENVRKGKGLNLEQENIMKKNNVPNWYIESCKKIKYMFPKAHAAAYVIMAFKVAYFKIYYPIEFYITYFTIRANVFDAEHMIHGKEKVKKAMNDIESKGKEASFREKEMLTILKVCFEMYLRGIKFLPIDLYKSHAFNFQKIEDAILPPLNSLPGLGVTAAENIMQSRKDGVFLSQEDLKQRAKLNKNVMALFEKNGCFKCLPESSQITFFE